LEKRQTLQEKKSEINHPIRQKDVKMWQAVTGILEKRDYDTGMNLNNWIEHFSALFVLHDRFFN
jgi:hypothetical protein